MSSVIRGSDNFDTANTASLTNSFAVASGGSVTAGNIVTITDAGEVGVYPSLNTSGEPVAVGFSADVAAISKDGSRAVSIVSPSSSGGNAVITITGAALSGTADAVIGTTTLSHTTNYYSGFYTYSGLSHRYKAYALTNDKFLIEHSASGSYYGGTLYAGVYADFLLIQVDSSGNVSQVGILAGVDWVYSGGYVDPFSHGQNFFPAGALSATQEVFTAYQLRAPNSYRYLTITADTSSNTISYAVDAETVNLAFYTKGIFVNSGSAFGKALGNTAYYGSYSSNNFGTISSTSLSLPNYASGGDWYPISSSIAIGHYVDTNGDNIIATLSINQTTGVFTLVDYGIVNVAQLSGAPDYIDSYDGIGAVVGKGTNIFTLSVDASGNLETTATNYIATTPTIELPQYSSNLKFEFNTSDTVFAIYTNSALVRKLVPVYVTTYTAEQINVVGVAEESASTGNVSVVISGIATVSGLTAGVSYYLDEDLMDGSFATSGSVYVGKAISSNKLLLGFN